jgi:hypothetical protein
MVDKVPMEHVFLRVLRFFPINIVPPMLEVHSFIYHRHHTTSISATDNVVEQTRIILRTAQFRVLSAVQQKLLNSQLGSASCTYGHQSKYSLEHTRKHYAPHNNHVNGSGRGQKSLLWSSLSAITCGRSSQFFKRYVR